MLEVGEWSGALKVSLSFWVAQGDSNAINSNFIPPQLSDDDNAIVEALTLILEDAGYEVEATSNGDTIHEVKEQLPDLILLDI